jgi:hypothetical protein
MTEYDRDNVGEIIHGKGTWFTANLFRLIARTDANNRRKMFNAFPAEVEVVHQYLTGKLYSASKNVNTEV